MKLHFKFRQGRICNNFTRHAGEAPPSGSWENHTSHNQTGHPTIEGPVCANGLPEFVSPDKLEIPPVKYKSVFDDNTGPDGAHSLALNGSKPGGPVKDANGADVNQFPGSIMLDEELGWRTLSAGEARFRGLDSGIWQVPV